MEQETYTKMHQIEQQHWWFVARRKIIRKILHHFLPKDKPLNILEIGCGTGGNLSMLSEFGLISAMELNQEAREHANKKGVCQVKEGKLPDNIPFLEKFDLICLFDVLEHIEDDCIAVSKLKTLLHENGKIIFTVPAYQFLWSSHDEDHHHKRRYTLKKLNKIFHQNGLKINYSTYFNTLLFPAILIARKIYFPFLNKRKQNTDLPNITINKILDTIFSLELKLIPVISLPFGVSILTIVNK